MAQRTLRRGRAGSDAPPPKPRFLLGAALVILALGLFTVQIHVTAAAITHLKPQSPFIGARACARSAVPLGPLASLPLSSRIP